MYVYTGAVSRLPPTAPAYGGYGGVARREDPTEGAAYAMSFRLLGGIIHSWFTFTYTSGRGAPTKSVRFPHPSTPSSPPPPSPTGPPSPTAPPPRPPHTRAARSSPAPAPVTTLTFTLRLSCRALNHSVLVALVAALALQSGGSGGEERVKSGALSGRRRCRRHRRRLTRRCLLGLAAQAETVSKT